MPFTHLHHLVPAPNPLILIIQPPTSIHRSTSQPHCNPPNSPRSKQMQRQHLPQLRHLFPYTTIAMPVPDPTESRPSNNVHARPSPPEERPSQRMRREDESQITRLSLYGHRHFVSHPPFTPHNSPRPVPYDTLGQDAKEVDLEGNNIGHATGSGAMPAIESIHDTLQTNPGISEDELIDQQVDQLIASCGPIREGVFDNLGAILASYQPGYSGSTGLDVNGSGNPTHQFQRATGSTPQMATRQSADWSCSEGVSASSSFSLGYQQRYSYIQADPYHFDQSLRPESGSFRQHGFANIPPPIASPSTAAYTSITSYPQSHSISYHPHAGFGTALCPPDTSSMARSLSTSDIPSMAAVPGGFSGLSASTSTSGNSTYAQPLSAFTVDQISSVNARSDDPRTASGTTKSHAQGYHQCTASAGSDPSLLQPGTTSQASASLSEPARLPPKPKRRLPSKSSGHAHQTAGTAESGGPMAGGAADQDDTTLEEESRWIDRSLSLATLMREMHLQCRVSGREGAQALRDLRSLFREMSHLCLESVPRIREERKHMSHRSMVRCVSEVH